MVKRMLFAGLLESIHGVTSIKELVAAVEACRRSGASERVKNLLPESQDCFPFTGWYRYSARGKP